MHKTQNISAYVLMNLAVPALLFKGGCVTSASA